MFAPLTADENMILRTHLTSGWYKQSAVYPMLSEPWQETGGLLDDLGDAHQAAMEASREAAARRNAELAEPEPEAGT
jgi:hypothetical protein